MQEKKKDKVVIFDFDGVIVDSVMLTYTYTKRSLPFLSWRIYRILFDNPLFIKAIRLYARFARRKHDPAGEKRRSEYTKEKLEQSALIENIDVVISDLAKRYHVALNTNASVANSVPILEKYELHQYFTVIKTRDDAGDKAAKTEAILKELSLESADAVFVTDSFRDVVHAKAVRVKSIGVLTGVHERKHFLARAVKDHVLCIAKQAREIQHCVDAYFGHGRS